MTQILTEVLTIDVSDCTIPGLYLRWKNKTGGIYSWLFQGNIITDIQQGESVRFEKFIDDLLNKKANFEVIKKELARGFHVFSIFEKINAPGMAEIIDSKLIEMWAGGDVWYTVDVKLELFDSQKDKTMCKIALFVTLPIVYSE